MEWLRNKISCLTAAIAMSVIIFSCSPVDLDFSYTPEEDGPSSEISRVPVKPYKDVFIIYSMGFNDLNSYLRSDIREILSSPLMTNQRDVLLILSHLSEGYQFSKQTSPSLTRVSRDINGDIVRDTLKKMPAGSIIANTDTLSSILKYVKEEFEAERYGILFSSHGTGWVPEGYVSDPEKFDPQDDDELIPILARPRQKRALYNIGREEDEPAVKSLGAHCISQYESIEMNINDMASAFPYKMDYMIFDACFMGCIETAYEFRNVTDKMVVSQTESLAEGMDYETMTSYIFTPSGPDLEGFCKNHYDFYNSKSGIYKSATISLIDCSRLEPLAQSAKHIFSTYRSGLNTLQTTRNVQQYFRNRYRSTQQWFYDFGDIVYKCGLSEADLDEFNRRLNDAVIYKGATEVFMNDFRITCHSGLSMYLPITYRRDYLNTFYKTLEWNKATGLVQ